MLLAALLLCAAQQGPASSPKPAEWRADLHRVVHLVDSVHPWPWRRTSSTDFHRGAQRLDAAIPTLRPEQIVVRMMRLVASLHDGHTTLYPAGRAGFDWWFPVRFTRFADSLAITAVDSAHIGLAGARVVRIGGVDAMAAADRAAQLSGADNSAGSSQLTGMLSNAVAMHALGLASPTTITLDVRTGDGASVQVQLPSHHTTWGDPGWMQRGEMFGPPGIPVVTAFGRRGPLDYRRQSTALPLALRNRIPIWLTWLPDDSTLYVQSNFIQDFNGTSFSAVIDSVFAAADSRPVRRLILDLRYNSGGDGSKVMEFVHDMIRRQALDAPGHFVVLTGGKTFSAAVLWLSALREHTTAVIVGDAAGAPRNHSGDAGTFPLPATGMVLQLSTLRHYGTRSTDTSRAEVPDFPVPMTAGAYFRGDDPALTLARSHTDLRKLSDIATANGADAMLAEYQQRTMAYRNVVGWRPFLEEEMNSAAYRLLRGNRVDDAIKAFRLNTEQYPGSSNTWDSYGEALLSHGDTAAAVASYRRAAALDPGNTTARDIVRRFGGR